MTQIAIENRSLPATIETTLRGLIRRVRLAIIVRGVLLTLAAAILGVLASMGIAVSWLPSEPWQHYALTFLWIGAAAAAALVWLVRPLAKSFSLTGIARVIEQRHPELQERLSSTVELLGSSDSPEIRGSQVLIDALAAEAVGDARTVRPRREITFRKVRPPLYVLGGAVAVIAVLLALYPRPMGRLLAKTVAPYLNLPNVFADDLRITPGDCVLAEGMRLDVTVSLLRADGAPRAKVRAASLRIERTGGTKNAFEMTSLPDGSFVYTSGPLSVDGPWGGEFRYRIRAGDARSQYYRVKVVPRPAARSIEVGYKYPDYMNRPEAPMLAGPGLITGPVGTVATVCIRLNKPAADAQLTINETAAEITQADPLNYTFSHNLTKDTGGKWKLLLTDEYGFRSDPLGGEIVVRPDSPPNVRILQPTGQEKLKLRPTDHLAIISSLADDFGLSRAEMLISIDGRQRKTVKLNVATTQPSDSAQGKPDRLDLTSQATLNLALLDLAGARKVTFRVRAWDNLPAGLGGPQEGTSKTRTIELDVKAPVYAFQVQLALDIRLREALQQIYKQLQAAKKISAPLRRSMPGTKTLTRQTTDKIDRMRETLLAAEDTSGRLAELVAGAYPKVSSKLTKLANDHVGRARELAGLVKITDAQKQRAELTDEADFQIDRALAVVSELLKELHVLTDLAERAVALEELAKRQEELAAAKMPTTQPNRKELGELSDKQWKQAQRQVAADTAEMVRQTPRAMHEALKAKGKQTTDLSEAAKQLQRSQQALAKSAADQQSIEEMKKQLAKIAAEQAKIARQTSQMARQTPKVAPTTAPAAKATKTTADAAKALTTTQPAKAIPAQADAIKSLEETAQRAAAEQLAAAAETMAAREEALAKHSETAKKYQAQAQAAQQAAAQHRAQQRQTLAPVAKRSTDLAQRQAALAKQAQQLEKASNPSQRARPAKAMQEAAENLRKGDLNSAHRQATQATRQAQSQANEMTRRETAAKQADAAAAKVAQQAGAKAAQADAKAKAARADAQAKTTQAKAARADAKAKTAQAKAAQAAAKAKAAQAKAAQAAADAAAKAKAPDAGQKATAAQTAAQAAKTAQQAGAKASQAAKTAQQAGAKADRAAKSAGQADTKAAKAAQSARQAAAKATQTAKQTGSKSAGAARSAAAGKQLAKQQAALTQEIAAAAKREAPILAKAAPSARQAAAQQGKADAATRKIQNLAKAQTGLTKQVQQLKELAKQATRQAADAMSRHDPTRNMQQAAGQLQRNRPDQAGKPQTAAAEQLRQIAKAARGGAKPGSPSTAASLARTSRSLAQTQRDLHKRTRKLVDQLTRAQAQRQQQELTRLRAEQQKIARQAAKLSDDVKAQSPQPDRIDTHAARSAAEASKQLAGNRLPEAAKSAGKAAGELGELAERLGKAQAAAPQSDAHAAAERRGKLAGRAGQLAQKQRQVGKQIADLAAGKMSQVLAGRQGQIAEETKKTTEDVKLLEEHIAELLPNAQARKSAQSAAKSLQQASAAQGKAGRAMSSGKPGQSVPSQQASAKSLAQAAAALGRLGRNFAAQARKNPPAPAGKGADETPGQLAEAYDAAQSAAQNQSSGEAAKAARLLAALAKQALQQARAMGMMPGAMGKQGMAMARGATLDSDARIGAVGTDLRAGELVELGISADDWARLPGRLRDQVLQGARTGGPEEYRTLIKRYFRALAKKASEKNSNRKEETK